MISQKTRARDNHIRVLYLQVGNQQTNKQAVKQYHQIVFFSAKVSNFTVNTSDLLDLRGREHRIRTDKFNLFCQTEL